MRLREIQHTIVKAEPHFKVALVNDKMPKDHAGLRGVNQQFKDAVLDLKRIPVLSHSASTVVANTFFRLTNSEQLIAPTGEIQAFVGSVNQLHNQAQQLLKVIEQVIPKEDPLTIGIRLPKITNFAEFVDAAKDLQFVAERMVLNKKPGTKVEIGGVDSGSIWLELKMDQEGIAVLISIFSAAASFLRYLAQKHQQKATMKGSLSAEDYAMLEKMLDKKDPAKREELVAQLEMPKEFGNDAMQALEIAAKLLDHGTVVRGSLNAPAQVQTQIAKLQQLLVEVEQTKQLTNEKQSLRLTEGAKPKSSATD